MFDLALRQGYPMLLVGPTGTGKTTIVTRHLLGGSRRSPDSGADGWPGDDSREQALVGGVPAAEWVPVFLTLSARTTANMTQDQVWTAVRSRGTGLVSVW
jgi:dynein heavy chain